MSTLKMLFLMIGLSTTATAQTTLVGIVQENYARFGQGDVPGILTTLDENIVWDHAGDPQVLNFAGVFRGKTGVGQFFQNVGTSTQITVFQPYNFRTEGNKVINDLHLEGIAVPTGKPFAADGVFTWTFNDQGLVTHWEMRGDMSNTEAAFR